MVGPSSGHDPLEVRGRTNPPPRWKIQTHLPNHEASNAYPLASFGPPPAQDLPAPLRPHSHAKAVGSLSPEIVGLKCSLHPRLLQAQNIPAVPILSFEVLARVNQSPSSGRMWVPCRGALSASNPHLDRGPEAWYDLGISVGTRSNPRPDEETGR